MMNIYNQKIPQTPVKDYQLGNGLDTYKRDRSLTKESIKEILQSGPIQFLIADVGHKLEIIDASQCFKFWKAEVEKHLADKPTRLEDYPNEYLYFASKWIAQGLSPVILLEKHH